MPSAPFGSKKTDQQAVRFFAFVELVGASAAQKTEAAEDVCRAKSETEMGNAYPA